MENEVLDKADQAIAKMFDQVKAQVDGQKAQYFSQSALNLAHARAILEGVKNPTKKTS